MTTHAQNFQISNMSVPELPSTISFPVEMFKAYLRRGYILFDNIIEFQGGIHARINSWIYQHQISKASNFQDSNTT